MSFLTIQDIEKIIAHDPGVREKYALKEFTHFLETGTHTGKTILLLASRFKKLITIEISEYYFNLSSNEFKNCHLENIEPYLGDSSVLLWDIIKNIDANFIYWLDGHWSSGDTGRGKKDCPLIEEITAISKRNRDEIIIIDDCSMFGTKINEDWLGITQENILKIFRPTQIFKHFSLNNRFCIFTRCTD